MVLSEFHIALFTLFYEQIIHLTLGGQLTLVGGVRSCVLLMDSLQQCYTNPTTSKPF
jgi:hypothetical protein